MSDPVRDASDTPLSDPTLTLRLWRVLIDETAPPLTTIMASHAVPWGKAFRQWRTDGHLLVWVNRQQIHDLPHARSGDVSPRGSRLSGIPVVAA